MKSKTAYKKKKKRFGRGNGSGLGKTCGRGQKGQKSRSGGGKGPGFEGGQMTFIRRLPKRGFSNARFKEDVVSLNIAQILTVKGDITPQSLYAAKLLRKKDSLVKILGQGKVDKPLKVKAHYFSKSAKEKINAAGGSAEVIK